MEPESRDPVRDGRALREMAQLANASTTPEMRPPPKKPNPNADHSGLVDLAALMAQQPNWLDDALARAKASAGTTLHPPSITPVALGSLAPTMSEVGDDSPQGVPRRSMPLLLASAGAGLLVAAACVFAIRMSHQPAATAEAPVQAAAVAAPHVDEPAIPPPPPAAATEAVAAPAAQPAQVAEAEQSPNAAPASAHESGGAATLHHHHGRHEARAAESHAAPLAAALAKEPAAPPAPAHAAAAPAAPHAGSALDAALRAAAGPAVAAPAPAPAPVAAAKAPPPAADGRPERPSGSAVTSALTEVLPSARKCVASMSDPSRALVTFGSDGAVHKVDVSGPAGSDAKASQCLRSAFGHAHVPPFAQASYAAGVNVRPQ